MIYKIARKIPGYFIINQLIPLNFKNTLNTTDVIARSKARLGAQAATKQSHNIHIYQCIFKIQLALNTSIRNKKQVCTLAILILPVPAFTFRHPF